MGGRSNSGPSDRRRNAVCVHDLGRMDIEGIGESHEQIEQRPVVHSLRDLRVGPSHVPKNLDLFVGDAVCVPGQCAHEFQEKALCLRDRRAVQIPVSQRLCDLSVLRSLQLQEPRVAAESIVTSIQSRYI